MKYTPTQAPRRTPLWAVYGPHCFPTLFCCILVDYVDQRPPTAIWGYSVFKGSPYFRTLGQDVTEWAEKNSLHTFFDDQQEALEYLRELTTPLEAAFKECDPTRYDR